AEGADLGIAFDGDADRVAFIDNHGEMISCDMITILIAQAYLREQRGATILYDLRSSWAVKEEVEQAGGTAVMSRVGHSYIKQQLRDMDAVFAGELSGHYYFRDNFYCDSGFMAMFKVLQLLSTDRRPVAEILAPMRRYFASGEINSRVNDPAGVLAALEKKYAALKQFSLDGLSIEAAD
ncbi:MAG TPA: phosphomannomutase/phosphoglucomutase, partial [bacterium]|nr:phosphomannomutase/phosphoglucomutase [bacterium]